MKYLKFTIFIWLVYSAKAGNFETVLYNQNNGLEQSYIYTLLQDENNYLWIGTQEGLFNFDGYSFKKFTKKDGLVDNLIISGFKDSAGKLYFGHFSGTITTYYNHEFDSIRLSDDLLQPIAFLEHDQTIFILTRNHGIFTINGKATSQFGHEELSGKIASNFSILNQEILISHNSGLLILNINDHQFRQFAMLEKEAGKHLIAGQKFNNGCWLWSEKSGLLQLNDNMEYSTSISTGQIPFQPEFMYEDDYGNLWLGSKIAGLVKLARDPVSQQLAIENILNEPWLYANTVSCFTQDHEGNYWAGTLGSGLIYLKQQMVKTYPIRETGRLNAIIPYRHDQFVIGTESGAYHCYFDPDSNEWQLKATHWLADGIEVTALFQHDDLIYIGTATHGIFVVNTDGNVKEIPFNRVLRKGAIRTIVQQGAILYAAVSGHGFYQISSSIQQFNTSSGFIHNEIYDLHIDQQDQLWIAMHTNGLSVKKGDQFQHLTVQNQLEARDINAIEQDRNNNLWIATAGYGLYNYDENFNLLAHFEKEQIKANYGFFLLNQDEHIFMGSQHGIVKINIENDSIEHIELNKLPGQSMPVLNGAAINAQGDIVLINPESYQTINQELKRLVKREHKLLLTNFKIFNQNTAVSEKLPGSSVIDINDYMSLKPRDNHLNIEFLSISFAEPTNMVYSYQLNNDQNLWSEPTSYNQVSYPNLNPGIYTLQIKSALGAGNSEHLLTVKFKIPPPFYRQIWFIVACCISFVGLTYSFYQLKNRNIRQQNKRLEELVNERTHELKEINDELLTTQEDVQQKNDQLLHLNNTLEGQVRERTFALKEALSEYDTFLYNASHALKGPVARLKGLTTLIKIENPDIAAQNIRLFDCEHDRLIKILNKLTAVHTIFNCKPVREDVSLLAIIEDYISRSKSPFQPIFGTNFNDRIWAHPEIVTIILENLLENAIMFSKHENPLHQIRINSSRKDNFYLVEIDDNGIGIEKEVIPHIFKMYYRGSEGSKGNGLGLYLVKKGLEKINGRIEVESEVMKYTKFRVWVPV